MARYLSLTLLDGFGRTTSKRVEFQDEILLADYVLNANQFMTEFAAVSDLQIIKAQMLLDDGLTLPATDPAGSNVDVGATVSGYVEGGVGKKASFKIPGIKQDFIDAQGNVVLTAPPVEALLDEFVNGGTSQFYLSDGEEIDSWVAGKLDR